MTTWFTNVVLKAIFNFLAEAFSKWLQAVYDKKQNEQKNADLKDQLNNAKTEQERRNANADLSNRLGG